MMDGRRYCVRTWDPVLEKFTNQDGVECDNLTIWQLRSCLRRLRGMGYSCHYTSFDCDGDFNVLVTRMEMKR
jgi:hypothetical protein